MKHGLLAQKMGMMQLFIDDGVCIPVTVLKVGANTVVQKKTVATDGYCALQLGFGDIREKLLTKPQLGHFEKNKVAPTRFLREFVVSPEHMDSIEAGQQLTIKDLISLEAVEKPGVSVDISGISKGKGFAGVMKRHNFSGFRRTHGTHESFRGGGSIGCRERPGKVFKGQKMAGHMGVDRVTVQNLRVVRVLEDELVICVRGAVPGPKNGLVEIRLSTRKPTAVPGLTIQEGETSKNPLKASKKAAPKK